MASYFCVDRGRALPLGATRLEDGVNFALFSKHATHAWLSFFHPGENSPYLELELHPERDRTGEIWHIWVGGLAPDVEYCWRLDMRPNPNPQIHRFDPNRFLLDPYAQVLVGGEQWGALAERRCALPHDHFDWEMDRPLNVPLSESVIYELHVRGFTRHESSDVTAPGTYLGLTEKIPYLKRLGVTAVELLPVYEFEEADTDRSNPLLGSTLLNMWGYQPIAFFAPNAAYANGRKPGAAVGEFKEMVKRFHAAGLEVILDVVFNHTAEGDERGLTHSFRGIDNSIYYQLDEQGKYRNYSGCGNTFNCNHPVVRSLITDCLHYWVMEMHVDGFRFDLASVLGRGVDGNPLADPPLLERLAYDPVLANTKLIAEAWDAAGLYQVGSFPAWGRWAEWNGKYRDDLRRFVKSDTGMVSVLAQRLTGSPDLYASSGRQSRHSINFVTCHDGFTLADLVSYDQKHNEANGEDNRDGASENFSWNCGVEGPTEDESINLLRGRQMRNLATLLLLSGGVPMIMAGDEIARTQGGNNNAYCQDNATGWVDWTLAEKNGGLLNFFQRMIAFRAGHEAFRHIDWGPQTEEGHTRVTFHGIFPHQPDWAPDSHSLAMELQWGTERIYLIANAFWGTLRFQLPTLAAPGRWTLVEDTGNENPRGPELPVQDWYDAGPRSVVVLEAL
ncbi:isoamylase [uncultured Paludibaculum sp.]|uniref:glycogen debranching protein n=1 Tax=uncultured Paludibaculum sp. TaxID=1765020 RepID=UPI002AAB6685|nr:isoamylase [uncultured Paludibaculum sp.]